MASAASSDTSLRGLALLELDSSGDLMHVWSYPGVDERTKQVLLARSNLAPGAAHAAHAPRAKEFLFHRWNNVWHYSLAAFSVEVPKNHGTFSPAWRAVWTRPPPFFICG